MKYKNAFSFNDEENNELQNDFNLVNYIQFEPKLEGEFYLKYFVKKLLFDTDIIDLNDFLDHHYHYCDNPEKFYQLLELKVIPKIKEITEQREIGMGGTKYYDEKELADGFVETEGVIKNWNFDYPIMIHQTELLNLHHSFEKKIQIITHFINEYKESSEPKSLQWTAGPSHLAVIIRELIDKGYMTAEKSRGEINNSKLARELFKTFEIEACDSPKSIEIYLSPGNKRYKVAKEGFDKLEFNIPDVDFT